MSEHQLMFLVDYANRHGRRTVRMLRAISGGDAVHKLENSPSGLIAVYEVNVVGDRYAERRR